MYLEMLRAASPVRKWCVESGRLFLVWPDHARSVVESARAALGPLALSPCPNCLITSVSVVVLRRPQSDARSELLERALSSVVDVEQHGSPCPAMRAWLHIHRSQLFRVFAQRCQAQGCDPVPGAVLLPCGSRSDVSTPARKQLRAVRAALDTAAALWRALSQGLSRPRASVEVRVERHRPVLVRRLRADAEVPRSHTSPVARRGDVTGLLRSQAVGVWPGARQGSDCHRSPEARDCEQASSRPHATVDEARASRRQVGEEVLEAVIVATIRAQERPAGPPTQISDMGASQHHV